MVDDYIVQHNDLQPEPYLVTVNRMYMGMGFGPLPEPSAAVFPSISVVAAVVVHNATPLAELAEAEVG